MRNVTTLVSLTFASVLIAAALTSCERPSEPMPASGASGETTSAASDGINWLSDLATALQEAQRDGKPVMMEFWANWCGVCKRMDRQTLADAGVIKEAARWIAIRVDVDQNPELANKHQVSGVPTVVFLRPDGSTIRTFSGFAAPPEMLALMREAFSEAKTAKTSTATSDQFAGKTKNDALDNIKPASPDAEAASRVVGFVIKKMLVFQDVLKQ